MATGALIGAQVGLGFMQMAEARNSADAITAQAEFDARQAEFNSQLVGFQRKEILRQAQRDTTRRESQVSQMVGEQKVALAAQGIEVESELGRTLEKEERRIGLEDVQAIRNNAWREAMGLEIKRTDMLTGAQMTRAAGISKASTTLATGGLQGISQFIGAGRTYIRNK